MPPQPRCRLDVLRDYSDEPRFLALEELRVKVGQRRCDPLIRFGHLLLVVNKTTRAETHCAVFGGTRSDYEPVFQKWCSSSQAIISPKAKLNTPAQRRITPLRASKRRAVKTNGTLITALMISIPPIEPIPNTA